jgi:hypothetical protein
VLVVGVVAALAIFMAPSATRSDDLGSRTGATHHVADASDVRGTPAVARVAPRESLERAVKHRSMVAAMLAMLVFVPALLWRRARPHGAQHGTVTAAPSPFLGRAPPRPLALHA